MNFPVGTVVTKGDLPNKAVAIANELAEKKFNGYIVQTVKGEIIEEGTLFFRDGTLSACVVECMVLKRIYKGKEALDLFLNQTKGKGFFQVVELTRSQVDLVEAFDETIMLHEVNLKELPKLIPVTYGIKFKGNAKRENVLERYGLSDLKK
ncbi:MAG: hypothetical protein HON47_00560 [Candidatus Diapherotrites archaeon]|jgi:hypothetical protein|uniref:Uncharacterized protein n=1 Tax=Candidatus Iainarchaeum sp. TaxID=3101447 RepID=A0A8T5GDL5_9ARCH|nr:hypothetical protein [Candidatus Diapherotrites archaeon]MBT7241696.1 hypothetical protein [Candidatus Diapherotrites archaeon]